MAYEALYRRYRPSKFADVAGQAHIVSALRNAVEGDRVGHAYLFSGPRGTGKTTSARILAKALNCTNLQGGEPCDECDSCDAFQSGGSYDLHELDAASNNGVEAMRDLIGKVALGSPGRTKVYILDEVHMLSSGAENALLKTLEEPPPHVVFVLATTEPNKVVPTIRSRTQHLEFSLLSMTEIGGLVDYVVDDAGLEITPEDRAYVIRAGGGSARDTLSALDQVVAAGGAPQGGEHLDALFQALIDRDGGQALAGIDGALQAGRDAATIATSLLHELRNVFLAVMRADLVHLPEAERDRATQRAAAMPPARITRAIEVIGESIIEMRQAPDPRVDLEVALLRLTRTDLDVDPAALLERIEALEHQIAAGAGSGAIAAPAPADAPPAQAPQTQAQTQAQQNPAPQAAPAQAAQTHAADGGYDIGGHDGADGYDDGLSATDPTQAPTTAAPAAPAGRGGKRGADMVRAALAEQGIGTPQPAAPTEQPAPAAPAESAVPAASAAPKGEPAAASSAPDGPPAKGKTLADVRRERQAAQAASGAPTNDAEVAAAAEARRQRQAAAQSPEQAPPEQHSAQQAPAQPAPPQQQASAQQAPPQQQAAVHQAPPEQAPQQQAAVHQAPPEQEAAVHQAPPEQAPQQQAAAQQAPPQQQGPGPQPEEGPAAAAGSVSRPPPLAEIEGVWQESLANMSGRVRSRFSAGRFLETTDTSVIFGLPNPVHRDRCEEVRAEVDEALSTHFGRPIALTLVVDASEPEPDFFTTPPSGGAGAVAEDDGAYEDETVDLDGLVDATDDAPSAEDRVLATFEGSTLLEDPTNEPHDR